MQIISTKADLRALAARLGVRHDWHEPDEQDVTARVEGNKLDNAGGPAGAKSEMHVILTHDGEDVASINLASLLGWAASTRD